MSGVAVYLPIEDWNRVLAILSQAPWNIANPIIMAMGEQLRNGQAAAQANPAPTTGPFGRGLDDDGMVNRNRPNGADRNP